MGVNRTRVLCGPKMEVPRHPNSQKTHYSIDLSSRKRQKLAQSQPFTKLSAKHSAKTEKGATINADSHKEGIKKEETQNGNQVQNHHTPFLALKGESAEHVRHRYTLYEKIWGHQKHSIEAILNSANNLLFADLLQYIKDPVSEKLDMAFLGLSSNTANNLRLLDEFSSYVADDLKSCAHVRMVRLNSKTCFNIKVAVREMIKQIVEGTAREAHADVDDGEGKPQKHEDEDSDSDNENDAENEDDGDEEIDEEEEEEETFDRSGGRISYDFEIVQDWMDSYKKKHRCEDSLRIIVVLDDSDGFSNEVLNQMLQLICIYTNRYPIKMIMALSSRNVGAWINSNITSKLRTLIESVKLEAKDNKDIGFQVIDDILLQNEITTQNPLLLDAHLSSIILNRFENSNNSIDSLITELKLSYMIHFYQSPLPALIDPAVVPEKFHFDALRKLPSFKTHIEDLVHRLEQDPENNDGGKILRLLQNNKELKSLLDESRGSIQKYQNAVMNAVNMVYWLCGGTTEKFQIYKLITNNQFINSVFSSGVLKKVSTYNVDEFEEFVSFVFGPHICDAIGIHSDEDILKLKEKLHVSTVGDIKEIITDYFHSNKHLNMKISDNLFNEVLTINGGRSELDELKPPVTIEENYENLMINLIRPNTRELIETALDEPQNINLWDFFVAFKQSLSRQQILTEIDRHVQSASDESKAKLSPIMESVKENDDTWDKMVYGWFLQGCYELNSMGLLKEKVKGDYMEKLIWKNL
ncbi:hypothetical protein JCM33374_g2700 [Metschnikowia sp. JCM 33374]|nr:hypothetical protein JCM33374_g2700 [Metschnikowia sp. JCM 33374]